MANLTKYQRDRKSDIDAYVLAYILRKGARLMGSRPMEETWQPTAQEFKKKGAIL